MRTWRWTPLIYSSCVLTLGLAGCSGTPETDSPTPSGSPDPSATETPAPNVETSLSLDSITLKQSPIGFYDVNFTLTGSSSLSVNMVAEYSFDGLKYTRATTIGKLTELNASVNGAAHTFQWDSLTDLGFVSKRVYFKIYGSGGGVDFAPQTKDLSVDNTPYDQPCTIEVDEPTQDDGDIPFTYRLTDPLGDYCTVTVLVKKGENTATATPSSSIPSDSLEDVLVPAGAPLEQVFVWDSLSNVGQFDDNVEVIFIAQDANNEFSDPVSLNVQNGTEPDPGDLVLTELFFFADWKDYVYLELMNVSHHPVNLRDMKVSTNGSQGLVVSSGADLILAPGGMSVMADKNAATLTPPAPTVVTVLANLSLSKTADTVKLWRMEGESEVIIDTVSYDYVNFGGKTAVEGHSIGLSWSKLDTTANDDWMSWCVEGTPLPPDTGLSTEETDFGSPGAPTECRPTTEPVPTFTR